jgi:hypothetical protein
VSSLLALQVRDRLIIIIIRQTTYIVFNKNFKNSKEISVKFRPLGTPKKNGCDL